MRIQLKRFCGMNLMLVGIDCLSKITIYDSIRGNKKIRHVRNVFENALIIQNSIQQYVLIIYSVVEFDLI